MSTDEPSVILFPEQRRCICGQPLLREGARYCSRWCRMVMADFVEFYELQFILRTEQWAGAMTEEEYLRQRMWDAVRRLPHSAEVLAEVLVEIAEIIAEEVESDEQR